MKKTTLVMLLALVFLALGLCPAYSQTTPTIPPNFEGRWERKSYVNMLTFTPTNVTTSTEDWSSTWILSSVSGDTYTYYKADNTSRTKTLNIKLENGSLIIKGDKGLGVDNWNSSWKKTAQQPTQQAQTNTAQQPKTNTTQQPQSLTPQPVKDEDFDVKQNKDNTITITNYKGTAKNIIIPDTLYGLKVTIIGNSAFQGKGLISVVIPDTVVTIEDGLEKRDWVISYIGAFYGNEELIKVTLGKGVKTIGNYAFSHCNLTEIIIPDSTLQSIGEAAFNDNQITEINLPSSLREIGERAFESNKIKKITFGTGLQTIKARTFRNNQITELNFPSSLKTIKGGAFANNQIQSLTIPNGVTSISDSSVYNSIFEVIKEGAFSKNPLTTVVIPVSLAKGISGGIFDSGSESKITRITIPAGMDEYTIKQNFEDSFVNFWINQNRAGGTYVKRGPIWAKE